MSAGNAGLRAARTIVCGALVITVAVLYFVYRPLSGNETGALILLAGMGLWGLFNA